MSSHFLSPPVGMMGASFVGMFLLVPVPGINIYSYFYLLVRDALASLVPTWFRTG
jgi:hypothetical protein